MAGMKDDGRSTAHRGTWLPAVAWAAFLLLAWLATALGAGAYLTAALALVPFGLAGLVLHRSRLAVAIAAVLGVLLLTLLSSVLDAMGLRAGAAVGATAVACLALPLGSGIGNYRRHQRDKWLQAARAPPAATPTQAAPTRPEGAGAKGATSRAAAPRPKASPRATAHSGKRTAAATPRKGR